MRLIVLAILVLTHITAHGFTFAPTSKLTKPDFLSVDQAFQLSVSNPDNGKLTAKWQISEGYYLYQEQFKLSGEQANKLHFSPFPAGENKHDQYYGDVTIYRNHLTLPIYYDITLPVGAEINAILSYQGCADKGLCYPPQKIPVQFTVPPITNATLLNNNQFQNSESNLKPSEAESINQLIHSKNMFTALAIMLGLGLLLSLTPCVLPMIPIVSAIVVGTRTSKLGSFYYSLVYVFAMAITYALIGGLVGLFGTQLNIQAHLQNPILLAISAVLFVLLAFAMFGFYELKLPSSWQSKFEPNSNNSISTWKTTVSTFFAGVFSTLVVSPCVSAPLAGVLLYISSQGDIWYGAMMLFVMALGMGAPLLAVGLFGPRILPKSGEWFNDIKVLMGFGLLAVAIWLMTRWLPASSHLYLWGSLALSLSGYFIHRAYSGQSHPVRWFLALLLFVVGLIGFLGGASGSTNPLLPLTNFASKNINNQEHENLFTKTITNLNELHDLIAGNDSRPIVLDFYADWCISCKILEQEIFRSPDVLPLIENIQLVRVDLTSNSLQNQEIMKQFTIFGPPSVLFLDQDGNEIKALSLIGEPTKQEFLQRIIAISSNR